MLLPQAIAIGHLRDPRLFPALFGDGFMMMII
jgi:hypothetical protein